MHTQLQQSQSTPKWKLVSTRSALAMISLLVIAAWCDVASAEPKGSSVKATYLYNCARFIAGMDSSQGAGGGEFIIGVLGESTWGHDLAEIAATKTAQGRQIRIRELASFADYEACDIIFVAGNVSGELLAAIIRQTDQQPVLVVAETPGFCELGGTANFQTSDDGRLVIEINIDAMSRRQLVVDGRLLKLAKIVRDSGHNGL